MREYNLKFKDLKEGKHYQNEKEHSFYILEGGLARSSTLEFPDITMKEIMKMNFKERIRPNLDTLSLLSILKYEWIAKNNIGEVHIYENKPNINFDGSNYKFVYRIRTKINKSLYKGVKFDWLDVGSYLHIPTLLKENYFKKPM